MIVVKQEEEYIMRVQQLEYFVSVAKNLNFTKAAEECYIAQSAISQQITALEDELGFHLFERHTRKVTLTEAGEAYYKDVVDILKNLEEAKSRAKYISEGISGTIRIGIAGYTQAVYLGVIKEFIAMYPNIHIEFVNMDTKTQYDQLINKDFDITLTAAFNVVTKSDIQTFGLKEYELALFMNEKHPLASHKRVSLEEASHYTNIFAAIESSVETQSTPSELYTMHNIPMPKIEYVKDHNMTTLLLDMNRGVAVAPKNIEVNMPANVVCRPLEDGKYTIPLAWAYAKNNDNPALEKLVNYIINKQK